MTDTVTEGECDGGSEFYRNSKWQDGNYSVYIILKVLISIDEILITIHRPGMLYHVKPLL
jgi:hypothetical protein